MFTLGRKDFPQKAAEETGPFIVMILLLGMSYYSLYSLSRCVKQKLPQSGIDFGFLPMYI